MKLHKQTGKISQLRSDFENYGLGCWKSCR